MRKERDLNPRYPLGVCVLSRDVLSATQPSFLKRRNHRKALIRFFARTLLFDSLFQDKFYSFPELKNSPWLADPDPPETELSFILTSSTPPS